MKGKTASKLMLAARIFITAALFAAAFAVLYVFGYITNFAAIDNLVGAMPVALALIFAGGGTALVWMKHTRRTMAVTVALAAVLVLSAALYPVALRGNWWIRPKTEYSGDSPDLSLYAPFKEDTLLVGLEEPSSLRLSGDMPVLDGATALYPVYAAFAQAVYSVDDYSEDMVRCTNTAGAYRSVISGDADIIFVAAPSVSQKKAAEEAGADLYFTPIGKEAFVFIVGKSNPVESLTDRQIKNIYSGRTATWGTLGWREGGGIVAFRRPETSGSESGLTNLVMKGLPVVAPQPIPGGALNGSNSLMQQVSVWYNGVQPALGYSYRYFAQSMYPNPDTKLLAIDGVYPSDENIADGTYPYVGEIYAVTRGKPQGDVAALIEWILSPQGQYLVQATGYAPIN